MARTSDKSSSENQGAEWSQEDILQKLRQREYSGSTTHIYDFTGGNHDRMLCSKDCHNWFERHFLQYSGWNLMASNARTCFYTLRSLHSDEPTMRAHILYHICSDYPGKPTWEQNSNPHAPWLVMDLCPQNALGRKLLRWNVVSEGISASRDVSFGSWWSQGLRPMATPPHSQRWNTLLICLLPCEKRCGAIILIATSAPSTPPSSPHSPLPQIHYSLPPT